MLRWTARFWLPLVILAVAGVGTFVVFRLHGVFGSHNEITREGSGIANDVVPYDPKRIVYEVWGPPGATATINYLDLQSDPQSVKNVTLPWSLVLTTTAPSSMPLVMAQGTGNTIGCRITIDDEVKDEQTATGVKAFTNCLVRAA